MPECVEILRRAITYAVLCCAVQKEGPPPGLYDQGNPYPSRAVSSSFMSRTPRFKTSHTVGRSTDDAVTP